jgi:SAM-dependent methyltransferase
MVRLKREIEGVRRNLAVPLPSYAQDPVGMAAVLPSLDAWVRQLEPGRALLAGAPRADLAIALARAGHWVTLCDLDDDGVAALHATLGPSEAGRLTLVNRTYGQAALTPSSFDLVVLSDVLHTYVDPMWLVNKAHRELKPDGLLVARVLAQGDTAPCRSHGASAATSRPAQAISVAVGQGLRGFERLLHTRLAPLLAGPLAREAIERGAHLETMRFAPGIGAVLTHMASVMPIERVRIGHSVRLRTCDALYGTAGPVRQALRRLLDVLPQEADAADLSRTAPRVLGLVARRSLSGPRILS